MKLKVLAPHHDPAAAASKHHQLINHAHAAAGGGGHRGAGYTQGRKRAQAENQARVENEVDQVRQPQHPHRNCRVSGAAENRIDQEKLENHEAAAQHHGRVSVSAGHQLGRRAHQLEKLRREHGSGRSHHQPDHHSNANRLNRAHRSLVRIPFSDPTRHHRGRGHR